MVLVWFAVTLLLIDSAQSLAVPTTPDKKNFHLVLKNVNFVPAKREVAKGFDILDFSVYLPRVPGQQKLLRQSLFNLPITLGKQEYSQQPRLIPYIPTFPTFTESPRHTESPVELFTQAVPKRLIGPFKLVKVESVPPILEPDPTSFPKQGRYTDVAVTTLKITPTQSSTRENHKKIKEERERVQEIFETSTPKKLFAKYEALTASEPQYFSNPVTPLKLYPQPPTSPTPVAERLIAPSPTTHLKLANHNYRKVVPQPPPPPTVVQPYITVLNYSQEKDLSYINPSEESYFKPLITPETVPDYPYFEALVASKEEEEREEKPVERKKKQKKLRKKKTKPLRVSYLEEDTLLHDSPHRGLLLDSVIYHPDEYETYRYPGHAYPESYEYNAQETQESQQRRPPPLRPPKYSANARNLLPITKRSDTDVDDEDEDESGEGYSSISDSPRAPYQGIFKTISSYISNKTEDEDLTTKKSEEPTTESPAEKGLQDEIRYFQDIFISQKSPHELEFGHVFDSPKGSEERFERKDMKAQRHQGKVKWAGKDGSYGEHYWDLAHPKASETDKEDEGQTDKEDEGQTDKENEGQTEDEGLDETESEEEKSE